MPEIIDTILSRRSIRQFTSESMDRETLILLLKAAMPAPTACNSQPWEFIVVTEPGMLDHIREKFLFARYNAPLLAMLRAAQAQAEDQEREISALNN